MSDVSLVDWGLAQRVGLAIGQPPGASPVAGERLFDQVALDRASADAADRVIAYTRLAPVGDLPRGEAIDRAEWTRNALITLRELAGELEREATGAIDLPGPLGDLGLAVLRRVTGAEAGIATGYASRRVLGQYDISLVGADRAPRLLFVSTNLATAHREIGESPEPFLRWIALHETTHAVQFASIPWLRPHVATLVSRLVVTGARALDRGDVRHALSSLLRNDPRDLWRALARGELIRSLASAEQAETLDQLQSTMAMIEGHAEHAMDAADRSDPTFERLRRRMEARRARRTGLDAILARLLGLDLKLRQYELGRGFCDEVVREGGVETLNRAWQSPATLPSLRELESPAEWLARVPGGARRQAA